MTPERWAVVKDAFDRVVDLEPDARAAALLEACGEDVELRREVETLLISDKKSGILDDATATALDPNPAKLAPSAFLSPGVRIGPYVVSGLRGAGSMGEVYQARDPRLGRDIALKLLPQEFAEDPSRLRLFEREARAASALSHPNIVTIYDVGHHDGRPYIAMEFVGGTTLRERLRGGALLDSELRDLGTQIAEGLAQAHAAGIVHRDLKPENIMVTTEGRAKILDFGVAKLAAADRGFDRATAADRPAGIDQTRGILGTVGYMSPEQALGLPVDFRSDQFSFGAILYEMASGRRAFAGSTPLEVLMAVHRDSPAPLAGGAQRGGFAAIVDRCLKKDRNERWASTGELARALGALGSATPSKRRAPWIIAGALAAVASIVFLVRDRSAGEREAASLAVMPFANETGNQGADYLSDGITENVIANLSGLPNLRIMARSTVFRYKNRSIDPTEVGRSLGVGAVLLGRLSSKDGLLVCDAELVDARNGARLWGGRIERKEADLPSLAGDLSREISRGLALAMTPKSEGRLARSAPANPEAYRLTLQGQYFWNRRTREGIERGLQFFEQAVKLDPNYAPAHAGIADANVLLAWYGFAAPKDVFPAVRRSAETAISLDDELFEPHCALAYEYLYHEWNYDAAEREFLKAIALSPKSPRPRHWYAYYLGVLGRYKEALAQLEKALDLDPLNLAVRTSLAQFAALAGDPDRAIQEARRALEVEPHFFAAHQVLGWTYEMQGRYDDALDALGLAKEYGANPVSVDADRARVLAEAGRAADARRVLGEIEALGATGYVPPIDLAAAQLALGRRAEALALVQRAVEERDLGVVTLPNNRLFKSLVDDPQYRAMIDRIAPTRRAGA